MSSEALLDACRQLPVAGRVRLAEELWDSIEDEPADDGAELTATDRAELVRALAEYRANPAAGEAWEAVKGRILARL